MICTSCGRKPAEADRDTCFRCRVATVGFGWRGGGHLYGRANFAERTNREWIAEHVGDPKREGIAHLGSQEWQG